MGRALQQIRDQQRPCQSAPRCSSSRREPQSGLRPRSRLAHLLHAAIYAPRSSAWLLVRVALFHINCTARPRRVRLLLHPFCLLAAQPTACLCSVILSRRGYPEQPAQCAIVAAHTHQPLYYYASRSICYYIHLTASAVAAEIPQPFAGHLDSTQDHFQDDNSQPRADLGLQVLTFC
jgi:hypothetical protein